jgi:hypothetical protein
MRGKSIITWLITAAAIALPLLMASAAQAGSGCHDTDGGQANGGSATAQGTTKSG